MVNPYARKLDPAPPHTVKLFNRMVAARVRAHESNAAIMAAARNAAIIAELLDAGEARIAAAMLEVTA
jgi:hypothetical protein